MGIWAQRRIVEMAAENGERWGIYLPALLTRAQPVRQEVGNRGDLCLRYRGRTFFGIKTTSRSCTETVHL
jgi:hypothetical protein